MTRELGKQTGLHFLLEDCVLPSQRRKSSFAAWAEPPWPMSTIGFVGANERSLTHSSFHQMPRWPSHPISCLVSVYTLEGTLAKFSLRSFQKSSFRSTVSPELRIFFGFAMSQRKHSTNSRPSFVKISNYQSMGYQPCGSALRLLLLGFLEQQDQFPRAWPQNSCQIFASPSPRSCRELMGS